MTENTNTVVLSAEANGLLQHVKGMFTKVTNNDSLTDEDVIVTLLAGFVDGIEKQEGGCCSDSNGKKEGGCCSDAEGKKAGKCSGNCAC